MKKKTVDPDGYSPDDIVGRLHRSIDSGIYGLDYTIIARDKNESFFRRYCITEDDRIGILKKLTIQNHDGWELSNDPVHPNDVMHFFNYSLKLFPRGIEDADEENVDLYIKITWTKDNNMLIVISFHD